MGPMRRITTWLLTLPLAIGGSQLAHAEAYRLVYADTHERSHVLAESGHGYLQHFPFAVALGLAVIGVALVSRARGRTGELAAWPFAAIPVATFALQETLERGGDLSALIEPTTLVGLALQLPFALLAYAVARLLLQAVDALAARLRPAPRSRRTSLFPLPLELRLSPLPRLAFGLAQRGPPRSR